MTDHLPGKQCVYNVMTHINNFQMTITWFIPVLMRTCTEPMNWLISITHDCSTLEWAEAMYF